mmetsp:Transcript_39941/g.94059  ORF Transcript_39941/g.94059 Transcript_39941/m.94059 type:complete len:259 (-) Transcript_39941:2299-3075(-)
MEDAIHICQLPKLALAELIQAAEIFDLNDFALGQCSCQSCRSGSAQEHELLRLQLLIRQQPVNHSLAQPTSGTSEHIRCRSASHSPWCNTWQLGRGLNCPLQALHVNGALQQVLCLSPNVRFAMEPGSKGGEPIRFCHGLGGLAQQGCRNKEPLHLKFAGLHGNRLARTRNHGSSGCGRTHHNQTASCTRFKQPVHHLHESPALPDLCLLINEGSIGQGANCHHPRTTLHGCHRLLEDLLRWLHAQVQSIWPEAWLCL